MTAMNRDHSAMQLHEVLDDGEAKPEPACLSRHGAIFLTKSIENVGDKFCRDSGAGIGNRQFDGRAPTSSRSSMSWFCAMAFPTIVSIAFGFLTLFDRVGLKHASPAEDRVERGLELVARGGQKLVLEPRSFLRRLSLSSVAKRARLRSVDVGEAVFTRELGDYERLPRPLQALRIRRDGRHGASAEERRLAV
jgi:hypothetical protein